MIQTESNIADAKWISAYSYLLYKTFIETKQNENKQKSECFLRKHKHKADENN